MQKNPQNPLNLKFKEPMPKKGLKNTYFSRQQQEVLNAEGGEPLSLMYSQLLQNYENVKDDYTLVRKRYDDLVASHSDAVSKLEHSQVSPENDLQSLSIFLSARTVELFLAYFF